MLASEVSTKKKQKERKKEKKNSVKSFLSCLPLKLGNREVKVETECSSAIVCRMSLTCTQFQHFTGMPYGTARSIHKGSMCQSRKHFCDLKSLDVVVANMTEHLNKYPVRKQSREDHFFCFRTCLFHVLVWQRTEYIRWVGGSRIPIAIRYILDNLVSRNCKKR